MTDVKSLQRRVLIIEDNSETRDLYTLALNGNDVDVRACISATEALKYLKTAHRPDLILCDYMMPEMDGATFIREIRQNEQWKQICVILVSGLDDLDRVAKECGANGFLKKPFGLDELEELVLHHLQDPA